MPVVTSNDIRDEQALLAKRARELQTALDHAHAAGDALGPYEGPLRKQVDDLKAALITARDATALRVRHNEGLLAHGLLAQQR